MKKLLAASAAVALSGGLAFAANVPLQSGPWDPTNGLGFINALVQSINSNIGGIVFSLPAAVVTTDTSADVLASHTMGIGALATGKTFWIKAYGVNSADSNVKTITFNFGASNCAVIVTGSSAKWFASFQVTETGSATQTSECHGTQGTTSIVSNQATNWTIPVPTAATAITVTGTAATSGTTTANMIQMGYDR